LLLRPSNFLLLDEPTNHLDMRAKDVLLESLKEFTGTVVFVSHDRYFLDRLATRVFEIEGGELRVFPGNYEDYVWRKQGGTQTAPTLDDVLSGVPVAEPISIPLGNSAAVQSPAKRVNPLKLKQMQERARELEERVSTLEASVRETEEAIGRFVSPQESLRLSQQLEGQRAELESAMSEWEQLSEQIEATA
jgi:ATP-binding cassette subfamily F protein 3